MCRTAKAGVVGTECHLDLVEGTVSDLNASLDQTLGRLLDRHGDGSVIVRRSDDQIDLLQNTTLVRGVVVSERSAGSFNNPDTFGWYGCRNCTDILTSDFRVTDEL